MSGMDMGEIPFTAIVTYYEYYPLGSFHSFNVIIRKIDRTVVEDVKEESSNKTTKKVTKKES